MSLIFTSICSHLAAVAEAQTSWCCVCSLLWRVQSPAISEYSAKQHPVLVIISMTIALPYLSLTPLMLNIIYF